MFKEFLCTLSQNNLLEFELCGDRITLSIFLKGESSGSGSYSKTSRAAPAIFYFLMQGLNLLPL